MIDRHDCSYELVSTCHSPDLVLPVALKEEVTQPLLMKPILDPKEFKNYRPVLNLPFSNKVLKYAEVSQL